MDFEEASKRTHRLLVLSSRLIRAIGEYQNEPPQHQDGAFMKVQDAVEQLTRIMQLYWPQDLVVGDYSRDERDLLANIGGWAHRLTRAERFQVPPEVIWQFMTDLPNLMEIVIINATKDPVPA